MSNERVTRQCRRCGGWPRHASCTCLDGPLFDPPAPQRPEPVTVRLDLPDVAGHCDHFAYHEASDTVTLWHTHNGIPIGTGIW